MAETELESALYRVSCPCVINAAENSPELEEIKRINHEYQAEIQNLISGNRYDGKEDFAVVLQPFLQTFFIPHIGEGEADPSFFSVDCFQISERAQAEMAINLWNNMLEPVGRKQAYNNFTYDRSKIHSISNLPEITTTTPAPHSGSTTIIPPTVIVPKCPSPIPVWVPVVVGICSLLAGLFVSWLILTRISRKKNKKERKIEMKGTQF
uniref:Uncharacterized protein n=1 Tax=Mola mola TaxID=94237 RepID=A0A3Q3WYE9_MOLML